VVAKAGDFLMILAPGMLPCLWFQNLRHLTTGLKNLGPGVAPKVNRYGQVGARQSHYSVPARSIGLTVRVVLRASEVIVFDGRTEIARHERSVVKKSQTFVLDHYLDVLRARRAPCPARPRSRRLARPGVHHGARGILGGPR
jgi:hypothetical protein